MNVCAPHGMSIGSQIINGVAMDACPGGMHDCELNDVVKVAAKEALSAIQQLDETSGTTRLDFGKHAGYTYSEIATRDEQYCQWVRELSNATGRMARFQSYLTRRWEVEAPIRMVKEVDRLNIERKFKKDSLKRKRESEEHRQKMAKARADVLKERMRTSSGTQLVGLSGNIELFEEQVLKRLQLTDLLNIPSVCRSMRDTTHGRGEEWLKIASSAMASRSSLLVAPTQKNRHDEAVKRFFGFPINWILPTICYNSVKLCGFDNYIKLKRVMDDLQRTSYARMRNEVRLAIKDWKTKRKHFETCVCAMRKRF
mgnify:CR=1 FL=1